MTRGSNRRDLPTSGSGWIDYSCPVETWEYWNDRFGRDISPELQVKIGRALAGFESRKKEYYDQPKQRQDRKQLERSLRATIRSGVYSDPAFGRWVELHSTHLPEASVSEKADEMLRDYSIAPDDYSMESPKPEPLYTRELNKLLREYGFPVSTGSAGDLYAISKDARDNDAPETAFVEFVRRCIWNDGPSVKFCSRIRGLVRRMPTSL